MPTGSDDSLSSKGRGLRCWVTPPTEARAVACRPEDQGGSLGAVGPLFHPPKPPTSPLPTESRKKVKLLQSLRTIESGVKMMAALGGRLMALKRGERSRPARSAPLGFFGHGALAGVIC